MVEDEVANPISLLWHRISGRPLEDPESPAEQVPEPLADGGYLQWSRDPAVGLFAVLPLWILYEALRMSLSPEMRNGAEHMVLATMSSLWPPALTIFRVLFAALVAGCALSLFRRQVPWGRVAVVAAIEGTFYGLLLGPMAIALAEPMAGALIESPGNPLNAGFAPSHTNLAADLVASLGAGIFEELVFRLGLVSLLALLFHRIAVGFAAPRGLATLAAVCTAAVLFAWFHHLPPALEPFRLGPFLFRTAAGLILGMLFVMRGFGVAVYTHAIYDAVYYLEGGP